MRRILFLSVILEFCLVILASAQDTPVLLMLRRSEQSDTSGCNFVEELTRFVYNEIIANKVSLWDSPSKEIRITGTTLQEIEKNSNTSFIEQENVFMYENWGNNKKEIITKTLGFSFANRTGATEEVSYGYVDYKDLNELFLKNKINTNANGIYSSTYTTYVLSKNFAFNIVQFAGKPVTSVAESEDIKRTYLKGLKFNESLLGYYPSDKYVSYIVDTYSETTDEKTANSKILLKAIENYLRSNEEVFYNLGGDRITSHIQKNKFRVTKVEVNEIWRKMNGVISYEPRSLKIFVNDSALNEMTPKDISEMEVTVNDLNLRTFLTTKNFSYILTKVNSQMIRRKDAYLYQKAMITAEWNRVIEYVINY